MVFIVFWTLQSQLVKRTILWKNLCFMLKSTAALMVNPRVITWNLMAALSLMRPGVSFICFSQPLIWICRKDSGLCVALALHSEASLLPERSWYRPSSGLRLAERYPGLPLAKRPSLLYLVLRSQQLDTFLSSFLLALAPSSPAPCL